MEICANKTKLVVTSTIKCESKEQMTYLATSAVTDRASMIEAISIRCLKIVTVHDELLHARGHMSNSYGLLKLAYVIFQ